MKQLALAIVCLTLVAPTLACSSSSKNKKNDEATAKSQPAKDEKTAQEVFIQGNEKLDAGDYEAAAALYSDAVDKDPKRVDIHVNKAIAEARAGDFEQSVLTIEDAVSNGGENDPLVYYTLGNIYHRQGMYGYAARAFRNSLAHGDEQNLDTLTNLASSYLLMKEYDKAEETYTFMQELAPDDPRPYVGLAMSNQVQLNEEKALEFYDKAIATDPDYPQAWFNRADLHSRMENYQAAIDDFERFLELTNDKKMAKRANTYLDRLKDKVE